MTFILAWLGKDIITDDDRKKAGMPLEPWIPTAEEIASGPRTNDEDATSSSEA